MGLSLRSSWDWTPDEWAWSPDQGRYQPKYGAPKAHVILNLSTDGVRPAKAYDYWRYIAYYDFDADSRRSKDGAEPFQASLAIAAALGCSRATLYRAFADRDISLADYIKEARLSRAAQVLSKGAAPETLTDLAHDCGFTNADHFRREFRRRFGVSPSEFRMFHATGPLRRQDSPGDRAGPTGSDPRSSG